jgi:hypothetical protein
VQRERDIFYDTDGIQERQKENVRACTRCAGALSIESASSLGRHILGVHIPRHACIRCQETALAWFEEARREPSFSHIYLQDRVQRTYERVP